VPYAQWLGADPREQLRLPGAGGRAGTPCGLRNLGATCYLNVLVQVLARNLILRDVLLCGDTDGSPQPQTQSAAASAPAPAAAAAVARGAVRALQLAIGHLLQGPTRVHSLQPFVEVMGLDSNVQQDPHEFHKLFFDLIGDYGGECSYLASRELRSFITGQEASVVKCSNCKYESERPAAFQDIELSIEGGCKSLQDCLELYYREEDMVGENQYSCSHCDKKSDATRRTKLLSSPSVLTVQLMRNIYDRETFQKKKLANHISFSRSLFLGKEEYVLVAVLYHKGPSGHSGHYVAEILDWEADDWWFFNDEEVTKVTDMAAFLDQCATDAKQVIDLDNEHSTPPEPPKKRTNKSGGCVKMTFTSRKKEAYLMSYVKKKDYDRAVRAKRSQLPDVVQSSIAAADSGVQREARVYDEKKGLLERKADGRKDIIKELRSMPPPHSREEFRLVATRWLRQWATGIADREGGAGGAGAAAGGDEGEVICIDSDDVDATVGDGADGDGDGDVDADADTDADTDADAAVSSNIPNSRTSSGSDLSSSLFDAEIQNMCHVCTKHTADPAGVSPFDVKHYKFLSEMAYSQLLSAGDGRCDVEIKKSTSLCKECVGGVDSRGQELEREISLIERVVDAVDSDDIERRDSQPDESIYLLSKEWLLGVKRVCAKEKKVLERIKQEIRLCVPNTKNNPFSADEADILACDSLERGDVNTNVNQSLFCQHDSHAKNFRKKSVGVSIETWRTLQAETGDRFAWIEVPDDSEECPVCVLETSATLEEKRATRDARTNETSSKALHDLFVRKSIFPPILNCILPVTKLENHRKAKSMRELLVSSSGRFCLITSSWLGLWRSYIDDTRLTAMDRFDPAELLCRHGLALVPSCFASRQAFLKHCEDSESKVERTDSVFKGRVDGIPMCELITEEQYDELIWHDRVRLSCAAAGDGAADADADAVSAAHSPPAVHKVCVTIAADEAPLFGSHSGGRDWVWGPSVCEACVSDAKTASRVNRTVYADEAVRVVKLRKGEAPSGGDGGEGGSRSRRTRRSQPVDVYVSSTDTVGLLKMKIFEAIPEAVPILQHLFYGAAELTNNVDSLQTVGILVGDTLHVAVDEDACEDGVDSFMRSAGILSETDFAGDASRGRADAKEDGFSGSIFGGRKDSSAALQGGEAGKRPVTSVVFDLSGDSREGFQTKTGPMSPVDDSTEVMNNRKRRKTGLATEVCE
jgi:ubiquitin C-terminal hydrolase